jgi:hypothetical protein
MSYFSAFVPVQQAGTAIRGLQGCARHEKLQKYVARTEVVGNIFPGWEDKTEILAYTLLANQPSNIAVAKMCSFFNVIQYGRKYGS